MKTTLLTLSFLHFFLLSFSQSVISGKILDEKGEGIPGANISIRDTYDGASSAVDGSFSFKTNETGTQTIVSTFVGYKSFEQIIEITGKPIELIIVLKEEINQLEAVTISAGSFTAGEEKRRTILKAVDIATTAGATADIAGALNTLPGTTKVGESGRLFVRGGGSNETRTFIDGLVVLDAYGPSAPNTPSRGRFLPFMFKGTSFSTGGYSAEYGQALSSALVLSSKDKAEMNQTDIGFLSVGTDLAHTQVWDRASASAKIQYTNIRPYYSILSQRVDWIDPLVSFQGSSAYRQQIGKDGLLKVFGNFNHSTFALNNHDIDQPELKQRMDLTNRYGYGNVAYQKPLNENWSLRSGFAYSYNENAAQFNFHPATEVEKGIHTKLVLENSVSDKIELRFGGELIARSYSASKQDEISLQTFSSSFNESIAASFVEMEAYASNHFVVKGGMRTEYNSLLRQASLDPRVSLAYRPGKQGQFSFAYGTFRQSAQNQYLRVNNNLNSERAEHFILNYQIINNKRTFRVETYYKKYKDLVKFMDADGFVLNNNGNGYAKGVEFFWRDSQTLRNVDYWISYSFLDTQRDYLNFPSSATPTFASKHNFSFVYKHFVTKLKSQLGFTYSYSSGRPYYNPNNENFNSDQTPDYHDVSANVAYLPKNWLIIYLSCTNLLARDNIFGYTYSSTPDANGVYASRAVTQPAPHFLMAGVFITITKNKSINQLPNL
ncbi:MAG: TonB-dependent receptor [Cyclobacteriaceae bacterium]|nr:TonB-dependent receptor [Cyclobacteriaceae bacterium]